MTDKEEVFTPRPEDLRKRLDTILAKHFSTLTRSQIKKMIESGHITVNHRMTKPGYLLKSKDLVSIKLHPTTKDISLRPENIPVPIVFEDEDIAVIDKPAGLSVHPSPTVKSGTLVNALLFHLKELAQTSDAARPGIVHRLDKFTSGLLVVAKNAESHRNLVDQFKTRKVTKEYIALVYGTVDKKSGTIELAIGRDPFDRKKISPRSRHPKQAITKYDVLEDLSGFTLLGIKLLTGRTHQIRVHLNSIGFPIVGDQVYGGQRFKTTQNPAKRKAILELKRYFLHATRLGFTHPRTGKPLSFDSPLPVDLQNLLTLLR